MKILVKIICFLIIIITSILLYSRYIGTTGLITKEIVIENSNINNSFDGLKIVHLTDIHYKRIITEKRIDDLINEINLLKPDIVALTGDLLDKDSIITNADEEFLISKLSKINAKYGKYAVIGNHDYIFDNNILQNIYTKSDFILLDNSYDIIYNENNDNIFIGGLANVSYKKADIDKTMEYFNNNDDINYKIILVHEPDYSDTIVEKYPNINLILAGHSHNGQVNIPYLKELFLPAYSRKYYEGFYELNDTKLYISSGIGVSRINFRLFNKPSINFYRINKTISN